jgi:hypothetical protein
VSGVVSSQSCVDDVGEGTHGYASCTVPINDIWDCITGKCTLDSGDAWHNYGIMTTLLLQTLEAVWLILCRFCMTCTSDL